MVKIQADQQKIQVSSPAYFWEWDGATDFFSLYDSEHHLIARAQHQPFVVITGQNPLAKKNSFAIKGDHVSIHYSEVNGTSGITVSWLFKADFIYLEPLCYESSTAEEIVQIVYFPALDGDSYKPSFYSRYAVVPGLSMSTNISPIVDLHSRLNVTAVLGSGAMRGPGFTQQWGLPAHYFCTFNTSERWNAIGAKNLLSGAACWGLAELPAGDFRLEVREIGLSPVLNLRGDLWKQLKTPGIIQLGFSFILTFGAQYHEAIRNYYKILLREKIIQPKSNSQKKNDVLLAPQYNTWGVESAKAMQPEELTEDIVLDIFNKFRRSGMQARTFLIDDKWEGQYGELKHDETRFPNFEALLENIRSEGYYIGLWAAFLRCQDPSVLGLNESHLLQTAEGKPLWLAHGTSRYGIFDVTQPLVQQMLAERAKQFIQRYKPDLIKFDFGYELPSLDVAAPGDMNWAGERLLQKGLEVVVGAMKAENPDLVIMYYGLSPLLIEHYDLHSPDDLVYCGGDYDLETNRRIFFSSLCGELGMPTYGSSGYDWASAPDIWFDSAPAGTLGSLQCFDGDENGDMPRPEWIAKFNGLSAILRPTTVFRIEPLDSTRQGGLRAGFSPSWARIENGKLVLLALRTHKFDGKPASGKYQDLLRTDVGLVISSLTESGIAESMRLGLVPFGDGTCTLRRAPTLEAEARTRVVAHYFGGRTGPYPFKRQNGQILLNLHESYRNQIVEWLEIIFD